MNRLLYILPILLASCGQPGKKPQDQISQVVKEQIETTSKSIEKTITFKDHNGRAVLIGDKIDLLNNELQAITTLNESSIVEIAGLSDSLFQKTNDYCDAFRYVKIRTESQKGIINGRNVYQITESQKDTSFNYKERKFDIKTTSFFGIGVSDEDGLTFCDKYYEPVVLIESESKQPKLIEIIENDISKKAIGNDDFKYFELMANDGADDKIKKFKQTDKGIILTIRREFQEGWNEFQVLLKLSDGTIKAEYLNYGEIKY